MDIIVNIHENKAEGAVNEIDSKVAKSAEVDQCMVVLYTTFKKFL